MSILKNYSLETYIHHIYNIIKKVLEIILNETHTIIIRRLINDNTPTSKIILTLTFNYNTFLDLYCFIFNYFSCYLKKKS